MGGGGAVFITSKEHYIIKIMITDKERINRYTEIRNLKRIGWSFKDISIRFKISRQRVEQIFRNEPEFRICSICNILIDDNSQRKICKNCLLTIGYQKTGRDYIRERVRVRDNYTCQSCGLKRTPDDAKKEHKKAFDVHHLEGLCGKKSKGYDKKNTMSCLITLCHKCHFNRHDHSYNMAKQKA